MRRKNAASVNPRVGPLPKRILAHNVRALLESRPFLWMLGSSMKKSALFAFALALSSAAVWAEPPQHIDINGLGGEKKGAAQVIEDVIVPVPSEIFSVLDKQGRPAWSEVLRPMKQPVRPQGGPEQIALTLGSVVAEGFVAVEAENAVEVKNIGRSVLSLSAAIENEGRSFSAASAIISAADKKGLERRPQGVGPRVDGRKERDGPNSQPGSGATGESRRLAARHRGAHHGRDERLHQAERGVAPPACCMLSFFKRRLDALDATKKKDPLVEKIHQGLNDIEPLMSGEGEDHRRKRSRRSSASPRI